MDLGTLLRQMREERQRVIDDAVIRMAIIPVPEHILKAVKLLKEKE